VPRPSARLSANGPTRPRVAVARPLSVARAPAVIDQRAQLARPELNARTQQVGPWCDTIAPNGTPTEGEGVSLFRDETAQFSSPALIGTGESTAKPFWGKAKWQMSQHHSGKA